jgi:hypothetical protein
MARNEADKEAGLVGWAPLGTDGAHRQITGGDSEALDHADLKK